MVSLGAKRGVDVSPTPPQDCVRGKKVGSNSAHVEKLDDDVSDFLKVYLGIKKGCGK